MKALQSIFILVFLIFCLRAKKSPFDTTNPSTAVSAFALTRPVTNNATPTPPSIVAGTIGLGSKTYTQLVINLTPPTGMTGTVQYKIFASYPDDCTTISQIEAAATLKLDYNSNISSYTITGLEPYQFYRVDIIAKDNTDAKVLFPTFCVQMDPNIAGTVKCSTGPTGIVTTLTGTGSIGSGDGNFSTATFNQPQGITAIGNVLYVADTTNQRIRKLDISNNTVSTLAGSTMGYTNAIGALAQFNSPTGIATDGNNLYVVDRSNYAIRLVNPSTGAVSTFAGPTTSIAGLTNATGTAARFNGPNYMIYNGIDFYLTDEDNCLVRKITTGAVVTTHAGGTCPGSANGSLLSSSFSQDIVSVTFYQNFIFLTDKTNNNIRKIDTNSGGNVITFISITNPYASAVYGKFIYITEATGNSIYKYNIETGVGGIFVGTGSSGSADGTGTNASFNAPRALIFAGNTLYVADTNNHKIRKIE